MNSQVQTIAVCKAECLSYVSVRALASVYVYVCVKNYFTRYNGNSRRTGGMPWGYIGITRSQVEVATQKPAGS